MATQHEQKPSNPDHATLPARPRRASINFRELRRLVSIRQVLGLIGWQPVRPNGPQLRGPCPVHKSTRPTSRIFSVNTERNIFRCFKCGAKGNQLDLWVALSGLSLYEAALDLCDRLGIETPELEQQRRGTRTS
jgi:DNA primase